MLKIGKTQNWSRQSTYDEAFITALADLESAQRQAQYLREDLSQIKKRIAELTQLVKSLAPLAHSPESRRYIDELQQIVSESGTGRGGPVYNNVVRLFETDDREQWTATDIREALIERGNAASTKAIYNCLDYLARKGQLRRIGRGQYVATENGLGFVLDQEIESADQEQGEQSNN